MFYQQQPYRDNYLRIQEAGNWSIQTHIHSFYELLWCEYGQLEIIIVNQTYVLKAGEAVLLFPYQPHSYPAEQKGQGFCCTFAGDLIGRFTEQYANYVPKENKFRFSTRGLRVTDESDVFAKKAFLYNVCSQAAGQLEFEYASAEGRRLLEKIFLLTEEHFRQGEFTLQTLAELLKYDYGYISKYFLQKTGMKYNYYLNLRRVTEAGRMFRKRMADSVADAAYACGYSNVRSFNRNFKSIIGKTPQEYIREYVQNK